MLSTTSRVVGIRWARKDFRKFRLYSYSASRMKDNYSLSIYDSLTEKSKVVNPGETDSTNGTKRKGMAWYTCGPTVYDVSHLGHARTYVSLDFIQRAMLYIYKLQCATMNDPPPPPVFIMNITDIDDKILARAKEQNTAPLDLARKFENEFFEDMDALNVMRPTIVTRVSEHVTLSIIPYIEKIIKNGMAYRSSDGSVYFDVTAFEATMGHLTRYGKLASRSSESTFFEWSNHNNNTNSDKRDPRDFVLWKSRHHDDEGVTWDSPWGYGRPGWHIECSAMIDSTMERFKHHVVHIHAGGADLKFPHHTNEIAQAEAYRWQCGFSKNAEWIPHWIHIGHLHIDGLKMSKSLKNFITIREILETDIDGSLLDSPADDFRCWCLGLSGSYRGQVTYSKARLIEAKAVRQKIIQFFLDGELWKKKSKAVPGILTIPWSKCEHDLVQDSVDGETKFHQGLMGYTSGDFDGSRILLTIIKMSENGSRYIKSVNVGTAPIYPLERILITVRKCLEVLGFTEKTFRAGLNDTSTSISFDRNGELIDELINFRKNVRDIALSALKDGAKSEVCKKLLIACDRLRDDSLPSLGIEVFDTHGPDDRKWRLCIPKKKDVSDTVKGVRLPNE